MAGEPPGGIEGAELHEQTACLGKGGGGRRVEPLELRGVCGANRGKVQRERCQIRLEDLGG